MAKDMSNAEVCIKLEEKLGHIEEKVDEMNKKLFGNGHPGIIVEQVNQNNQLETLVGYAERNAANIKKLYDVSTPAWLAKYWFKLGIIIVILSILTHILLPEVTIWSLLGLLK